MANLRGNPNLSIRLPRSEPEPPVVAEITVEPLEPEVKRAKEFILSFGNASTQGAAEMLPRAETVATLEPVGQE